MFNVLVYDEDRDYIAKLALELSRMNSAAYIFTACSTLEALKKQVGNAQHFDILVYDLKLKQLKEYIGGDVRHILLAEQLNRDAESEVFKYQNVEAFVEALDRAIGIKSKGDADLSTLKISLILSAEGGSGKTNFAIALAKVYSMDYDTVLLTFEPHSDLSERLNLKESKTMTDLFYMIKRQEQGISKGFRNQFEKDDHLGFTAIAPFNSYRDMQSLCQGDITALFKSIAAECGFKRIVIDTAGGLNGMNTELIEQVQEVFVVEGSKAHSAIRRDKLIRDLDKIKNEPLFKVQTLKNLTDSTQQQKYAGNNDKCLPFEPCIEASYRSPVYTLLELPYYKAISELIERGR